MNEIIELLAYELWLTIKEYDNSQYLKVCKEYENYKYLKAKKEKLENILNDLIILNK